MYLLSTYTTKMNLETAKILADAILCYTQSFSLVWHLFLSIYVIPFKQGVLGKLLISWNESNV